MASGFSLTRRLRIKSLNAARRLVDKTAEVRLTRHRELWKELRAYISRSGSTGCNFADYWQLYDTVRSRKPKEILECGTGVSTVVIAYALIENDREGSPGRVTSMEEIERYYDEAKALLPERMSGYVDFVCSPRTEDYYSLFRGVRYRDVPSRQYDFVFVDGPKYTAPSDGMITFDFDYIDVVRKAEQPVFGLVDKRVSTCYVLQKIFGPQKVRYSAVRHLGYVGPCTKADLRQFDARQPSSAFTDSFRLVGNSVLTLRW